MTTWLMKAGVMQRAAIGRYVRSQTRDARMISLHSAFSRRIDQRRILNPVGISAAVTEDNRIHISAWAALWEMDPKTRQTSQMARMPESRRKPRLDARRVLVPKTSNPSTISPINAIKIDS